MDQAERDHIRHELEIAANELFPGWIRRVELLQHDDAPWIEPGQLGLDPHPRTPRLRAAAGAHPRH